MYTPHTVRNSPFDLFSSSLQVVLPALKTLAEDGADATRVHFVDCVLAIAPLFVVSGASVDAQAEFNECVVPSLEAVAEDASWRVRAKFARQADKLVEVIGHALGAQHVLPAFARTLRDSEPEVRSAACSALLGVCRASDAAAFKGLVVPVLAGLAADTTPAVRYMPVFYLFFKIQQPICFILL